MNFIDYIVLGILASVIVCVVVFLIRKRKQKNSGCGRCSYRDNCVNKNCK